MYIYLLASIKAQEIFMIFSLHVNIDFFVQECHENASDSKMAALWQIISKGEGSERKANLKW